MGKVVQFRMVSLVWVVLASLAAQSIYAGWGADSVVTFGNILKCICGIVSSLFGWICWDISRRNPSETRSLGQLLVTWLLITFLTLNSKFVTRFKSVKTELVKKQKKYLMDCLQLNKHTKYSLDHNLADVDSVSRFRERHPLTSYDHYRPYVDMCLKGEENVMFDKKYPVCYFALTSGTSGKNKVYPINKSLAKVIYGAESNLMATVFANYDTSKASILPMAMLLPVPQFTKTELGLNMGSVGAYLIEDFPTAFTCVPKTLYCASRKSPITEKEFYYTSLIFVLQERIQYLAHSLAASTFTFYAILEADWPSICDNIEHGTIPDHINLVESERAELLSKLKPNPRRAEELRAEFNKGMKGIVHRIWPDLYAASCLLSGHFSQYREPLSVFLDGVVIYSQMHASSESLYGVNLWPMEEIIKYALIPTAAFFEFIPEEETGEESPSTVLAHQVEVGKRYEIVITNTFGLHRYRIGDVIEIVGFEEELPVYLFKYRLGQMLNACWEKTPESAFLDAVSKTSKDLEGRITVHQYMATENFNMINVSGSEVSSSSKGYVVFVEILEDSITFTEAETKQLDDNLRSFHELYDLLRTNGSIEQMKVYQVKRGTFDRLKDNLLKANVKTSPGQFKMPRVQRDKKHLEYLWENIKV